MQQSKLCVKCWNVFYKKSTISKKNREKSKACSRDCFVDIFIKSGSNATRGKRLTEEQKMRSNYFQKGHKNHGLARLEKWRANGGTVWNKGYYGYKLHGGNRMELKVAVRSSQKYINWRTSVFLRDGYKCVRCGINNKNLNADHIIPFSILLVQNNINTFEEAYNCDYLWDINNGRTLCFDCHKKTDTFGVRSMQKLREYLSFTNQYYGKPSITTDSAIHRCSSNR